MKIKKLLLTALCAVLSVGAWAQEPAGNPVAVGEYYLYNVETGTYLCSGNNWGSHASVAPYGMPITLAASGANYTLSTAYYYSGKFLNGEYMDGGTYDWTFTAVDGKDNTYTISNGTKYLRIDNTNKTLVVFNDNEQNNSCYWKLVKKQERIDAMASATSENPQDVTFLLGNSYFAKGEGLARGKNIVPSKWTGAQVTDYWGDDGDKANANYCIEMFEKTWDLYQTITGIPNGWYKVSAQAYERSTTVTPFIYANDEKVNVCPIEDGGNKPTGIGTAASAFKNGRYKTGVIEVYVSNGTLKVGIKCETQNDWCAFDNFTIEYIGAVKTPATSADYEALAQAISAAENHEIGFDKDEYAPYNNVEAVKLLAEAKNVDSSTPNEQDYITTLTSNLGGATWTANTEELNAFYPLSNYTTTSATDGANRVYALGWDKAGGNDAYNTRIMVAPDASNAGLTSNALFTKYNTNYGKVEGYTMPLKANQLYKITFDYAGWGNNPTTNIVVKDANGTTVTLSNTSYKPATNDGQSNADHWYSFETYFVTNEAGDYVVELNKVDKDQQQTVLSNMELKTSDGALARTTAEGKYGTICLPYAATVEGATVYTATLNNDKNAVVLAEVEDGKMVAGTPYIYQATADAQTFTYTSGNVKANPTNEGILKGVFAETVVPERSYVMQTQNDKQAFYLVNVDNYKSGAYKCYLTVPEETSEARLDIVIEGETGINDLGTENAIIVDGKYMQNNKVVIVKNGRKYNVTGQIVK